MQKIFQYLELILTVHRYSFVSCQRTYLVTKFIRNFFSIRVKFAMPIKEEINMKLQLNVLIFYWLNVALFSFYFQIATFLICKKALTKGKKYF